MDPRLGLLLAALAVAAGWQLYQWHGVALAVTVIAFWLLLQFNRTMRVMKNAADSPVGYVDSARQLEAKMRTGMLLMQVVAITHSLGRRVGSTDDVWAWADPESRELVVTFANGRCTRWTLLEPEQSSHPDG